MVESRSVNLGIQLPVADLGEGPEGPVPLIFGQKKEMTREKSQQGK